MKKVLEDWLAEDVGKGDFTSQAVVENSPCNALVTGGPGIISGIQICKELLIMFLNQPFLQRRRSSRQY